MEKVVKILKHAQVKKKTSKIKMFPNYTLIIS